MSNEKKIILQVDGGGIRGITPAIILAEIEERIRQKTGNKDFLLRDILHLCTGTSTGAIMTGLVAVGVPAKKIKEFYENEGVALFRDSKRLIGTRLIRRGVYNREPFLKKLEEILGRYAKKDVRLQDLPGTLVLTTTAYNLLSERTHFIKSDNEQDKVRQLKEVISWSALSAAHYFGGIKAHFEWKSYTHDPFPQHIITRKKAFFQDGGQGTQNCTLGFVLLEILGRKWEKDEVKLISLGTGNYIEALKFDDNKTFDWFKQVKMFIQNQAREEAALLQVLAANYLTQHHDNIKLFRLDYEADKEYGLDDISHVSIYKEQAYQLIENDVFKNLMNHLYAAV